MWLFIPHLRQTWSEWFSVHPGALHRWRDCGCGQVALVCLGSPQLPHLLCINLYRCLLSEFLQVSPYLHGVIDGCLYIHCFWLRQLAPKSQDRLLTNCPQWVVRACVKESTPGDTGAIAGKPTTWWWPLDRKPTTWWRPLTTWKGNIFELGFKRVLLIKSKTAIIILNFQFFNYY